MAIKDLLVYVDNDRQCVNRLQFAVQMAKHYQARLRGVYVRRRLEIPTYAEAYVPPDAIAAGEKSLMEMTARVIRKSVSLSLLNHPAGA